MSERATAASTPLVSFDRVGKRFGVAAALTDVTLDILPEQFVVLLGPSGSGKTTLLRCAAGIERITGGTIRLDGVVVDDGRRQVPPERRDLAMVFQDYALWPHMTAHENVRYALKRRHLPRTEADRRARAMLDRVGLEGLGVRYPSELSGGQQQRVALARALVARPRLLLFDEPLSNLDAGLRERLRIEIATLVREAGTTALYITHDQSEAFALADRIGVLEQGRLVQSGTPEVIYGHPATPFVARLTGLAGELHGQMVASGGAGQARVATCGTIVAAYGAGELAPETPVRLLVRPSAVRLLSPTDGAGQFGGVVRDVAFSGRGYEHVVAVPDGQQLSGIFAETRWERGQAVGVHLAPGGCLVFPDDATAVPRPSPRGTPG
jgi:iron(III) transport system ATP-binding protein